MIPSPGAPHNNLNSSNIILLSNHLIAQLSNSQFSHRNDQQIDASRPQYSRYYRPSWPLCVVLETEQAQMGAGRSSTHGLVSAVSPAQLALLVLGDEESSLVWSITLPSCARAHTSQGFSFSSKKILLLNFINFFKSAYLCL